MAYVFLAGAIAAEVIATLSLRASEGFSKPGPTALMAVGYLAAFVFLSLALQRGLSIGVAYGVWAGVGVAAVALLSIPLFGETLTTIQLSGLALVIVGILALEAGAHD